MAVSHFFNKIYQQNMRKAPLVVMVFNIKYMVREMTDF